MDWSLLEADLRDFYLSQLVVNREGLHFAGSNYGGPAVAFIHLCAEPLHIPPYNLQMRCYEQAFPEKVRALRKSMTKDFIGFFLEDCYFIIQSSPDKIFQTFINNTHSLLILQGEDQPLTEAELSGRWNGCSEDLLNYLGARYFKSIDVPFQAKNIEIFKWPSLSRLQLRNLWREIVKRANRDFPYGDFLVQGKNFCLHGDEIKEDWEPLSLAYFIHSWRVGPFVEWALEKITKWYSCEDGDILITLQNYGLNTLLRTDYVRPLAEAIVTTLRVVRQNI